MMLTQDEVDQIRSSVGPTEKSLVIIQGVMFMGPILFLSLSYSLKMPKADNDGTMPLLFVVVPCLLLAMSFVVPTLYGMFKPTGENSTTESLVKHYQSKHILVSALLEMGLFITVIAFLVVKNVPTWFLSIPACLIIVFLMRFSYPGKMTQWVLSELESK